MNRSKAKLNRKTYHKPDLTAYGSLQKLTAGGTGSKTENPGKDLQPEKRP